MVGSVVLTEGLFLGVSALWYEPAEPRSGASQRSLARSSLVDPGCAQPATSPDRRGRYTTADSEKPEVVTLATKPCLRLSCDVCTDVRSGKATEEGSRPSRFTAESVHGRVGSRPSRFTAESVHGRVGSRSSLHEHFLGSNAAVRAQISTLTGRFTRGYPEKCRRGPWRDRSAPPLRHEGHLHRSGKT
jgi:hypothetical protein